MKECAFIFDDVSVAPEKQIGLHSHSRWELSHVVCGAGTRTIGDLTEPFREGEVILIPPGIPHVWQFDPAVTDADGNIANLSVFFEPPVIAAMKDIFPETAAAVRRLESLNYAVGFQGEQRQNILRLMESMRGKTAERRFPLMMELLIAVSDFTDGVSSGKNSTLSRSAQRLEMVRVYCACNFARQISLDEMSRHVGMNKSAFCTFMRHNARMTFSEFLNGMRLERFKDKLCLTEGGIAETAFLCGFQNISYFNRIFRLKYGCSPKEFRRALTNYSK